MSMQSLRTALRSRMRLYPRLARHLWTFGESSRIGRAPVLLVCSDADRGYLHAGRRYAQVLDSLNERLLAAGLDTLTVAMPYSAVAGEQAYGRVATVNGIFARATVLQMITRRHGLANNPLIAAWERLLDRVRPEAIIGIQPTVELCVAARRRGV